ncbi:MAG: zinc-ribbon domain-containing protein [Armatimonadetes bacterium]|nr:zinc-ribbon domain-containing protein [Armatimonadota bacterium]
MEGGMQFLLIVAGLIGLIIGLWAVFYIPSRLYQKVGPNEVLVISGGGGVQIIPGGGKVVWPFIQKAERFSLELMTIDFVTPEVISNQGVPIIVEAVAQIKVQNLEDRLRTAVERFLSKNPHEIQDIVKQTLEGHLRAIIGKMTVENIIRDREEFARQVTDVSATDLGNMGFGIDSFSIKDIKDNKGYLEAFSRPQIAEIKKKATIAEAEAASVAQQESAKAQKLGQVEKNKQEQEISDSNRDLTIRKADNLALESQRKAEADLAYEISKTKRAQELEQEKVKIDIVRKTMELELQEREVARREKELVATIRKPVEAKQFEIETLANAQRNQAQTVATGQAEATKATGFANAEVVRATGQAEADAEKARGLAEADVNKAQGLAQAEVIRAQGVSEAEAMARKAEAWHVYNEAAVLQMFFQGLPEVVRAVSEPLSKTERIVMVSSGDGIGASKITKDIVNVVAELPPVVEALTGLDLKEMIKRVPAMGSFSGPSASAFKEKAVERVKEAVGAAVGARTAPSTVSPTETEEESKVKSRCPKCAAELRLGAKFCPYCGYKME